MNCKYCNENINSYWDCDLCDVCKEFPGEFLDKCLKLEGPYFLLFKAVMFFGRKCLQKLIEIEGYNQRKFKDIEYLFDERLPGRKRDYDY